MAPKEEPPITTGETRREIDALWDSVRELSGKIEERNKEVLVMSTQISYMVTILERLERGYLAQAPVCAIRGTRIDTLEKRVDGVETYGHRIENLEASNKVLKWLLGIATAILTTVGAERALKMLTN